MKKIGLLLAFCAVMSSVWAIPARKGGIVRVQPDGSEVTVYQHGDEHFHWLTNEDGEWLRQDEDGFFRVIEALNQTEIEARRMASPKRVMHKEVPLNIATRGLIILVNFKDVAFTTPKGELDSALMGVNYTRDYTYKRYNQTYHVTSEGSARQYFYDCSMGQYNPQFDVVGPVTLAQNMVNYGGNNSAVKIRTQSKWCMKLVSWWMIVWTFHCMTMIKTEWWISCISSMQDMVKQMEVALPPFGHINIIYRNIDI